MNQSQDEKNLTPYQIKALQKLREPFPENQVNLLPKPYSRDAPKGRCAECGGYHGLPAAHLRYVGHAPLTDRLLDADLSWGWVPMAYGDDGLPRLDANGGLWIWLTVAGITRPGYGDAQGKKGPDAMKERIGDALRNAGMRFGAALENWHKGELHVEIEVPEKYEDPPQDHSPPPPMQSPHDAYQTQIKAERPANDIEQPPVSDLISDAQIKRMFAIARNNGRQTEDVRAVLAEFDYFSSKDVKKSDYEQIIKILEDKSLTIRGDDSPGGKNG